MYKSLRHYIDFLESQGELLRIKEFTDPVLDITKTTDRECKSPGGGKALLFENTGSDFPVITNMMGSDRRIRYVLGIEEWDEINKRMDSLIGEVLQQRNSFYDKLKILPTLSGVSRWLPKTISGKGSCQQVRCDSLSLLPILKCWELDGGRFITLPLVHTRDPKSGGRNVGMYRMQVFDDMTTGMHWHRHKTGARHYDLLASMVASGECSDSKLPVAVALGGDPLYTYAATAPMPDGIDEYLLAGFLRDAPVKLVNCLTQPLQVPEDCDFVIEGYVDVLEEKVIEGPFGDHTGFYSLEDYYPKFHVTCITHRKGAIYPATIVGIPPMEDKYIAIATEKIFLTPIQFAIAPEIEDLYLPEEGVGHNFAIVKIKKSYPGQAQKVANALWGAGQMMFNKFIIIVSSEIDIRDKKALLAVLNEHFLPERDVYTTKGVLDILDHTSPVCGYGGKMCLDLTVKLIEELDGAGALPLSLRGETFNADSLKSAFVRFELPHIEILLDSKESIDSSPETIYRNLWLLGCNCDPVRDSVIVNGKLILDATSKEGRPDFHRPWPPEVR